MEYKINTELTKAAIHEVGTFDSRYFISVVYNYIATTNEDLFVDLNGDPIDEPSAHGVHVAFKSQGEATIFFNSMTLATIGFDILDAPTSIELEGPDGTIAIRELKRVFSITEEVINF